MRKSDKKLDNEIRKALTRLCEDKLKSQQGFEWLTHTANYSNFPASLKVVCVFDTNENLAQFESSSNKSNIVSTIANILSALNIKLSAPEKQLVFDCEEKCDQEHRGNWKARLG